MTFHQYSKEILTEYLGTVAYVDDLIFRDKNPEAKPIKFGKPTRESFVIGQEKTVKESSNVVVQESKRNVDPKKFTDAFIKKGIHCSLLEIENAEDPLDAIKKTLKKSDVVILDWQMHFDNGAKAKELLFSVINSSSDTELRLIVIFTNDPQYRNLLTDILIPKFEELGIVGVLYENGCKYKFGCSKIVVIEKTNGIESDTAVTDDQLPDRIIEEFCEITEGIVSNTALKAISVIKQNSHFLLGKLNKDIDPAILSHRALLSDPTESEEHVVSLISSEILGLLNYNDLNKVASIENIKSWLNDQISKDKINLRKNMKIRKHEDAVSEIEKILEKGIPNISPSKAKNKTWNKFIGELKHERDKSKISDLTSVFLGNINNAIQVDENFAHLMAFQSNYQLPKPRMDQGSVLRARIDSSDRYYVCIHPKCDCVRIKKSGEFFTFLPLKLVNVNERFDFIVRNSDGVKRLEINHNASAIEKFKFYPSKSGLPVFADSFNDDKWHFKGDIIENNGSVSTDFEFLGYLKQEFIQRTVNNYAGNLIRVGFSESEWLRRWAKRVN